MKETERERQDKKVKETNKVFKDIFCTHINYTLISTNHGRVKRY